MNFSSLEDALIHAASYRDRLVLIYGVRSAEFFQNFADENGLSALNLSLELAERLLQIQQSERSRMIPDAFTAFVSEYAGNALLLAHPEILFDPVLAVDPVRLFLNNARNTTLVVQWPGKVSASSLSYATPCHPEYRSWRLSELGGTILINADEDH